MSHPTWLIQIYEMTDEAAQASAVNLLSNAPGLTVETRGCEPGCWFLVVECSDPSKALNVHEMVLMVDQRAELTHSTTGPAREREMV